MSLGSAGCTPVPSGVAQGRPQTPQDPIEVCLLGWEIGTGDQEAGHRASWLKSLASRATCTGVWQREAEKRRRGHGALASVWEVGLSVLLPHSGASDSFPEADHPPLSPEPLCGFLWH